MMFHRIRTHDGDGSRDVYSDDLCKYIGFMGRGSSVLTV
jgi:hypothetical protein